MLLRRFCVNNAQLIVTVIHVLSRFSCHMRSYLFGPVSGVSTYDIGSTLWDSVCHHAHKMGHGECVSHPSQCPSDDHLTAHDSRSLQHTTMSHKLAEPYSGKNPVPKIATKLTSLANPEKATEAKAQQVQGRSGQRAEQET